MKTTILTLILFALAAFFAFSGAMAQTQNSRSAYFLKGSTYRHELNPAFMGERGYLGILPLLSNLTIGVQSSGGVGDFIFKKPNGSLTTFMDGEISSAEFLKKLPKSLKTGVFIDGSLFSLGFYAWGTFNTLGVSLKSNTNTYMPDELFKFMKNGMDSKEGARYKIKNLGVVSTTYAEIALGHSHKINEHLTIGVKLKGLVGLAKATMGIKELNLGLSEGKWTASAKEAELYLSGKGLVVPTKGETGKYQENDYLLEGGNRTEELKEGEKDQISYKGIDFKGGNAGPTGFGMAVDLGAVYKLDNAWTFSAAVLDLGFISWENTTKAIMDKTFEFNGFTDISVKGDKDNKGNKISNQIDQLKDELADFSKFQRVGQELNRKVALAATLNFGAQYTLPAYKRLNFGLLSSTRLQGVYSWTEARVSANVSPLSWVEASLNCALSNFGSTAGMMLNLHPRGFNLFMAADVPISNYESAYHIPLSPASVNVNVGITFTFGKVHM